MDLTPKQQTSEAIRQAEAILILTGQRPSVDQVTAVIGLAAILRKFGKRVSAVISDSLPQSTQLLDTSVIERNLGGMRDFILKLDTKKAQVSSLRYETADDKLNIIISPAKGGFAPSDVTFDYGQPSFAYDLAIVLGVPNRARIDRVYEQNLDLFANIPMVNLDFHRSNENYGAVNLIEPNASSLCEMLVALSESLQSGIIDAEIATILLMGIVASTDRFTAQHTTSKSLTVAAQMMAAGGRQQAVVKALYRGGDRADTRGGERERGDRGERSGHDQSRGNDRGRGARQEPVRNEAPHHEAPRPAAVSRSEAPRVEEPQSLPIIQPSHIEVSEPRSVAEAPAVEHRPEAPVGQPEPVLASEAVSSGQQEAISRPVMADFAAAAQVLAQRQPVNQTGSDDSPVSSSDQNRA